METLLRIILPTYFIVYFGIAFVAKRDGEEESQIYILNLKLGGEAQKLTKLSSGASNPKWSPDGLKIMFTSNVYPQCYQDSTNKKMVEQKKKLKYESCTRTHITLLRTFLFILEFSPVYD